MDDAPGRIFSTEITRLKEEEEVSGLTAMFWNTPKDGESLMLYEVGGVSLRRNPAPRLRDVLSDNSSRGDAP